MSVAGLPERCWTCPADRCTTHTLYDHLDNHDLLVGNYSLSSLDDDERDAELTRRDRDRYRILKRLTSGDSTLALKTIVSECVKGQPVGQCERFDGSDADYRFVHRYITELSERDPPLVRKRKTAGTCMVSPTPRLIDLISEGIAQTVHADDQIQYDREFARDIFSHSTELTETQRDHLENSLHRYVDRINDYRLLFDIHTYERGSSNPERMTKPYKTRFNSRGRVAKEFARFNDALERQFSKAQNAVLCTLTSDPGTFDDPSRPDPRSILKMTDNINPAFNRLMSYFDSDPTTKADTRNEGVPNWRPELDNEVTGRPRKRPEYIKFLEFDESGKPHLHILFFDVPERETDGMPWLIDKAELSQKWQDYGQAMIVDTWPLTYRDDLDDLDADFQSDQGFVDWYRYGDHSHDTEWIQDKFDDHDLIDFDSDTEQMASTAGGYIGKYLSATFGALLDKSGHEIELNKFNEKAAEWKLACYWATNRRFWSLSHSIRDAIKQDEHSRESPEVREAVRWASVDTLESECRNPILDRLARQSISLNEMESKLHTALKEIVTAPFVESTLPEPSDVGVLINYIGAFAYWDLPPLETNSSELDPEIELSPKIDAPKLATAGDRPPPVTTVWQENTMI